MTKIFKTDSQNVNQEDYKNLLQELKSIIDKGKRQAYKAVDNILVETRWQIGERIVREELNNKYKAEYGKVLIENLAVDLGVNMQRLYEIVRFYRVYPIFRSLSGKLSWKHYTYLITITDEKERKFYENKAIINSWSTRELSEQIKNQLYQKTENREIEETLKITLPEIVDIQKVFKPDYDLQFINITEDAKEKELEDKIIHNIIPFLKEFGEDFSFIGRQVPVRIDNETHLIDLVLYHRGIPCVILVDLKMGKIDSRDIGQINKYVGYFRRNKQYTHEKDAIGLIICEEAGKEEITYALDGLEEKIFVSVYKTKLPDENRIKKAIKLV